MERNKRATDFADKANLFLDPRSSAGFAAISLDRLHPDHTSHRAHTAKPAVLADTTQANKFDAAPVSRIQLRKRHLET
jgi:hypothetical protein